jgi:hypothetical protein
MCNQNSNIVARVDKFLMVYGFFYANVYNLFLLILGCKLFSPFFEYHLGVEVMETTIFRTFHGLKNVRNKLRRHGIKRRQGEDVDIG